MSKLIQLKLTWVMQAKTNFGKYSTKEQLYHGEKLSA